MENIEAWLDSHEVEMVEDIRRLVKIPSVVNIGEGGYPYGGMCKKVADSLVELANAYGLPAKNFEDRCAVVSYGKGSTLIEIWGHLDVVAEGDGWIYPPYECTRINDFLIGRGVSDNKGAVVAVLYALRFLKEYEIEPGVRINQVCGLCEEDGMEDAQHYLEYFGLPDYAFVSDCRFPLCYGEKGRCVVMLESEPLDISIVREFYAGESDNSVAGYAYANIYGKMISADGTPGHAAAPEKCLNPIGILANKVKVLILEKEGRSDLKEVSCMEFLCKTCSDGDGVGLGIECETPEFGKLSCQGTVARLLKNRLSIIYDIRYPANKDICFIMDKINSAAKNYGFTTKIQKQNTGYLRNIKHPWIQLLLKSYREITGDMSEPYVIGGNTYASYLGETAVPFGPVITKDFSSLGLPAGHGVGHGIDEVQSVSNLKTAVKVYVHAIMAFSELNKSQK